MDITGELVRLRAFRPDDAPAIAEALADPRVVAYLAQWAHGPYTLEQARAWTTEPATPGALNFAIESIADGAFVGSTGFHDIDHHNRHCGWGIWIGPPHHWGKGYGTEACVLSVEYAFRFLAMEKVHLYVYAGNDRARPSYEKAGFVSEGIRRRHYWRDGALTDVELMAVFRDHPLYSERIAPIA
ncbi:MAG: N-acetyltransferase [Candidatus Aeolococcus gillhamiae]|uniref:N-acetyltransferase n=1 Tax=Candidatus Aeolococcus gillhamiae TaxID=3127015 RepID=A0A2W5Z6J9_9BACT|nr:MAG: N-acetyltransferase [Candidatus Dormibacter sp. RRmetagenome_bin12]